MRSPGVHLARPNVQAGLAVLRPSLQNEAVSATPSSSWVAAYALHCRQVRGCPHVCLLARYLGSGLFG